MSINVTVTGNPVSINRGKMVTVDPNYAKKEFDKRRLMRLEQVRQQSKDIAEDVRNRVRKEKKKHMKQIEKEGEEKLRNWQNRKLLELQTQYKEALHELGAAHKQAKDLQDEAEVIAEQKEHNDEVSHQRGRVAVKQLQINKSQETLKKTIPIEQKKLVREIENTRAALVSNIKKNKPDNWKSRVKKKERKPSAEINITIPDSGSESEHSHSSNMSTQLPPVAEEAEDTVSSSCDCTTDDSGRRAILLSPDPKNLVPKTHPGLTKQREAGPSTKISHIPESQIVLGPPLDTRISDRIKRRTIMASQPDYRETVAQIHPTPYLETNTQIRDMINTRQMNRQYPSTGLENIDRKCTCGSNCNKFCKGNTTIEPVQQFIECQTCKCKKGQKDCPCYKSKDDDASLNLILSEPVPKGTSHNERSIQESTSSKVKYPQPYQEIPTKPPISLKEADAISQQTKAKLSTKDSNRVQYYDHPNRFSHEKQFPSNTHVERITSDSLEVHPNVTSEIEWFEKMKQRDAEAQLRGKKALEKERTRKHYEEMLKKLPQLERQERILEIKKDKPEYHMTEERLKEMERKKQNQLDNAFNKLFPNLEPAVVNLPSKRPERSNLKFSEDGSLSGRSLDVAKWDVDFEEPKMFTAHEVQEIVRAFTGQDPRDRQAKLKELLRSLKVQKDQLINEIKLLPKDESINALINDLNSFDDDDDERSDAKTRKKEKVSTERKRQREENDRAISDGSAESSSSTRHEKQKSGKSRQRRYHCETATGKSPSPRKKAKMKTRTKILILQNTSTQTTPKHVTIQPSKIEVESQPSTVSVDKVPGKICEKLHIPCDCNKENDSKTPDELCQIFIKLNDDETPEVIVKAKDQAVRNKSSRTSPKKVKSKSVGVGPDLYMNGIGPVKQVQSKALRADEVDTLKTRDSKVDIIEPKKDKKVQAKRKEKSWKEHLSKNSNSTSSTSYFSPPDFHKMQDYSNANKLLYNLHKNPQQRNLTGQSGDSGMSADPGLIAYIKKLLAKSRKSIDNLSVSTSDVQTPSQSVVEVETNNPAAELHNIMKLFNLKHEDLARELSYSPDSSPAHHNTSASSSEILQKLHAEENTLDSVAERISKSSTTGSSAILNHDGDNLNSNHFKSSILAQYSDITDSCSRRIANLAAMIKQIREEKIEMLQNPLGSKPKLKSPIPSEKDLSTAYLDLPLSKESSKHSSAESLDEEEIFKRLVEIDLSLAGKLGRFAQIPKENDKEEVKSKKDGSKDSTVSNTTDKELEARLQRLKENAPKDVPEKNTIPAKEVAFVPFLSDIPKLPKFAAHPDASVISNNNTNHKRPPPSKGLKVVRKFNENVALVPHELSTIVEADSQLSTKVGSGVPSPNASRTSLNLSALKDIELIILPEEKDKQLVDSKPSTSKPEEVPKITVPVTKNYDHQTSKTTLQGEMSKNSTKETSSSAMTSNDSSKVPCDDLTCSKISSTSKKSTELSSSSSDNIESIETMLRSIGMEWAIPTLHKTQEALALTSSSSSLDLSAKRKLRNSDSTNSEISLKEFLRKQMLSKISSSTLKSDASPASMLGEFSDLSAINNAVNSSTDKERQRTSTPVTTSKSTNKSKDSLKQAVFSGDSDISSVKNSHTHSKQR